MQVSRLTNKGRKRYNYLFGTNLKPKYAYRALVIDTGVNNIMNSIVRTMEFKTSGIAEARTRIDNAIQSQPFHRVGKWKKDSSSYVAIYEQNKTSPNPTRYRIILSRDKIND